MALTILAFLQIFNSDMHFDIGADIKDYMKEMNIPEDVVVTPAATVGN